VNVNVTQTPELEQERRCGKVEIPVGTGDGIRTKGRGLYIYGLVDQGRISTKSAFAYASVFGLDILVSPLPNSSVLGNMKSYTLLRVQ